MPFFNSKNTLIVCYLLMAYCAFVFYPKWNESKTEATLSWDVSGYYMYLPAVFIYNDVKHCGFKDSILAKYVPTPDFQQAFLHAQSGNYVFKYSSGLSITMLPLFCIAHLYCTNSNRYLADGFSFPYQLCIGIGMFLYALLGLYFFRKVLLHFFKDTTVAIVLIGIVFGTNYLDYSSINQAMSHNVLFVLYALLFHCTIVFYQKPSYKYAVAIGSIIGLATLIRPTEIIAVLIPICWQINRIAAIKDKFIFLQVHFLKFVLSAIIMIAIISIQLFYWKFVSNEWVVDSYQGSGFYWTRPHLYDYALSYKCGWLRYCPMMYLPIIGIVLFTGKGFHRFAIIPFIIISFYIVSAWDVWDYGNSSGRAMVQYYVALAFPFGMLVDYFNNTKWMKILFYSFFSLFVYLNVWWIYYAHKGNIHNSDSSYAYYWRVIGRWGVPIEVQKLLENLFVYEGKIKKSVPVYENNFNNDTSANAWIDSGKAKIKLNKQLQFSNNYSIKKSSSFKKWIRISAEINCREEEKIFWRYCQFGIKFFINKKVIQTNAIRVQRYVDEHGVVFFDAIVPKSWDEINLYFWNADSDKEIWIDNLKVITFDDELP